MHTSTELCKLDSHLLSKALISTTFSFKIQIFSNIRILTNEIDRRMYQLQLVRISSTMSLMLSMNNAMLLNPDAASLVDEEQGNFIFQY